MSERTANFRQRLRRAMLEYAFLRWESAVLIAVTLFGAGFSIIYRSNAGLPTWGWIAWLVFGSIAEIALVYFSLTDPQSAKEVLGRLLDEQFQPARLKDPELREKFNKALDYHRRIEATIIAGEHSLKRSSMLDTVSQVNAWQEHIYHLTKRLDRYRTEQPKLEEDRIEAEGRLHELREQLQRENDLDLKQQISSTVESLDLQLQTIKNLATTMEQAELKLEHTLSSLGTIYSQSMLLEAKRFDGTENKRLRDEINSEVRELDDLLHAMDKVY